MDHPQVTHIIKNGEPKRYETWTPKKIVINPCGCGYESVVTFHGQPLCEQCAKDEGIEV